MPAAIPETIKSKVISQWLLGLKREVIVENNNISAGAISNIINDWSIALGKPDADAFRELAKALNAAGLSPAQCAIGFRTRTLLNEQNIDADAAAQLIGDIYKKCKELEVTPSKFATSIKELIKVSEDHHIQLHKIEEYIDEKIAKKKELENELEYLKNEISTLKNQKSEIENARDLALHQKKMADLEIKSYSNAKQVLDRHKISIDEDLTKFANTVNCIAKYAYDPKRVIAEFNDIYYLDGKKRALEITTKELEDSVARLRLHESSLQDKIYLHSENLSVYNELADLGFRSSELRTLLDKIINIAKANDIDPWSAVKKLFKDIETQYNTKLGFEPQIENLKIELQSLNDKREKELQRLKSQPFVVPVLIGLLQRGLDEQDILKVAERCHNNLSNRTSYAEILRKETINIVQNVMKIPMENACLAMRR
jgi:hypothetical protein